MEGRHMEIVLSKSCIAALGCEECKKRFLCNMANESESNRKYIEDQLGLTLPKKDPPAVFKGAGTRGELGVLLFLISKNKRIVSMAKKTEIRDKYQYVDLGEPYVVFTEADQNELAKEDPESISELEYDTDHSSIQDILYCAEAGINYFYQFSFSPDFSNVISCLEPNARSVYSSHQILVSQKNFIRPDLIRIDSPKKGYPILQSNLTKGCNDGEKYILTICDIKTSEFTSSFYFELGYYMVLFKRWIDQEGWNAYFDISYSASILPFDMVGNSIRHEEEWLMEFSLVRDKLLRILNITIPSILTDLKSGRKQLVETVKRSGRCHLCDYYGGQYEGELYDQYISQEQNGRDKYKAYIENPQNHYCRFYLDSINDINILPGIKNSDIRYLQSKGIRNLDALKKELESRKKCVENAPLMANSEGLLKEIEVHGSRRINNKVEITNAIPPFKPDLRIYTLIRQDSQGRTLSYGIAYDIYVRNAVSDHKDLMKEINTNSGLIDNNLNRPDIVLVYSYDRKSKLTAFIEYILRLKEILEKYSKVKCFTSENSCQAISFGIFYWGRKTFEAFKVNLHELMVYMAENGWTVKELYTELSSTQINNKNTSIEKAIKEFAELFSDESVTQAERILKNPLFDLKAIYSELVAVDTNFNYNIIDVYNIVFNCAKNNYRCRPDSDDYSTYTYEQWFNYNQDQDLVRKGRLDTELKESDTKILNYLNMLHRQLYENDKLKEIVKKGKSPELQAINNNRLGIRKKSLLYWYLYQIMNDAYDQIETERNHIATDMQKQYGGTSIFIERELSDSELNNITLDIADNEKVYRISASAENANLDESSFGLTLYPADKLSETFKRIKNDPNNSNNQNCLCVNSPSMPSYKIRENQYAKVIDCKITYLDISNQIIKLSFSQDVLEIMNELQTRYGFDYSQKMYLEKAHSDIWVRRLKQIINYFDVGEKCRYHQNKKLNVLINPSLSHERNYDEDAVEKAFRSKIGLKDLLLDQSQKKAIATLYNDNIALLWGPPGTGKSHTLGHYLLLELIERQNCSVLLLGNYNATDNLINSFLSLIEKYGRDSNLCQKLDIIRIHSKYREMNSLNLPSGCSFRDWNFSDDPLRSDRQFIVLSSTPDQLANLANRNSKERVREKLNAIKDFDIVIVDEASQMDVGHFLPGLIKIEATNTTHSKIILAGDDKQLQPIHKKEIRGSNSYFYGSIYNYYKNYKDQAGNTVFTPVALNISRRSNQCIIDFIRDTFGYDKSFTAYDPVKSIKYRNANYSNKLYESVLTPDVGIALLEYSDGLSSQRNDFEVNQICNLVVEVWDYKIVGREDDLIEFFSKGIGIVVPHTAQKVALRKKMFDQFKQLQGIKDKYTDSEIRESINGAVDTVERFQGQERDLIVSGYVLGNEDAISNEEEFIYDNCRLNVVISRAKYKTVIFASRELMDNTSDNIEIIELQKAFQKLKDYCDTVEYIDEVGWNNGRVYTKQI